MPTHRLRIDYDEDTDELSVRHICTVTAGEHQITLSESVEMADRDAAVAALTELIDSNRKVMETLAGQSAVEHVAAVAGVQRRGRKQVKLGGEMGAIGKAGGEQ